MFSSRSRIFLLSRTVFFSAAALATSQLSVTHAESPSPRASSSAAPSTTQTRSTSNQGTPSTDSSIPEPPAPLVNPKVPGRTRLVVVGTGWASVSFLQNLNPKDDVDITVISPRPYFLYSPLLPAAATGSIEPRSIVEPIRNLLPINATYIEASGESFRGLAEGNGNSMDSSIVCRSHLSPDTPFEVGFDVLVFAPGSINNTFGTTGVQQNCLFLKSAEDASKIRTSLHDAYEKAALPIISPEEKKRLLSFICCGGGPTGSEVAAELVDAIKMDLERQFPSLKGIGKVTVIDSNSHVLSMFDRTIAEYATKKFAKDGINLILNARVQGVDATGVNIVHKKTSQAERIPAGTVIWATGIGQNPLAAQLIKSLPKGSQKNNRALTVDDRLRVIGSQGKVYALGDCATIETKKALAHAENLFNRFDIDQSGTLEVNELAALLDEASKEFPQFKEFVRLVRDGKGMERLTGTGPLKKEEDDKTKNASSSSSSFFGSFLMASNATGSKRTNNVIGAMGLGLAAPSDSSDVSDALRAVFEAADKDGNGKLDKEEFNTLLQSVDANLRSVPATAQVAKQQGKYLASTFNSGKYRKNSDTAALQSSSSSELDIDPEPFVWKDLGSMAFLGGDEAVAKLPGAGVVQGYLAGLLWRGFETANQQSYRSKFAVLFDQARTRIFGRDVTTTRR